MGKTAVSQIENWGIFLHSWIDGMVVVPLSFFTNLSMSLHPKVGPDVSFNSFLVIALSVTLKCPKVSCLLMYVKDMVGSLSALTLSQNRIMLPYLSDCHPDHFLSLVIHFQSPHVTATISSNDETLEVIVLSVKLAMVWFSY